MPPDLRSENPLLELKLTLSMELNTGSLFFQNIVISISSRVDSSEISFQLCGQGCAEQILNRANKAVIEPIMNVEVVYPQEFDDRVNKYLYEKHADIQEFELDNQVIALFLFRN